ncbi:hypothetical protein ACLOJK_031022 [Asimina triloba]
MGVVKGIPECKLYGRAAAVAAAMTTSLTAVSFDHRQRHGFMPLVRSHICKLGSFARLDSTADLDRITPAPTMTGDRLLLLQIPPQLLHPLPPLQGRRR